MKETLLEALREVARQYGVSLDTALEAARKYLKEKETEEMEGHGKAN